MGIHYKFASTKDFNTIPIDDGTVISIAAFKRRIFESLYRSYKKCDSNGLCLGTDLDFIITNAQTNEQYDDDSCLIANHSSVLIRRVPGTRRRRPIDTTTITLLEQQIPLSSSSSSSSKKTSSTGSESLCKSAVTSLSLTKSSQNSGFPCSDFSGNDDDSKIKALVNTPALDWSGIVENDGGRYGRMGAGLEKKTPHQGYVCYRCNVPGHFIQHCPTNGNPSYDFRGKRSAAAPILPQNEAAFDKEIWCLLPSKESSTSWSVNDIPPELLCPLCKQVMKDAALTSKCCFNSFCDSCIRDYLVSWKLKCVCGATQVLTDSIIPNITLRDTINRILEVGVSGNSSHGENSTAKASSSPAAASVAELSVKEQKRSADNIQDTGNKRKLADAPHSIAKKAKTTTGSTRLEELASQENVQTTEVEVQQKVVAAEEDVQQKAVSGEKAKKKKKRTSQEDKVRSHGMPVGSYGYNPYFGGMQAGMEGYAVPYYYGDGMSYGFYGMPFGM